MLNGSNVSFDEIAAVTPSQILDARIAAERGVRLYSAIRGLAEVQTDPELDSRTFEEFNQMAEDSFRSHPDDWMASLAASFLDAIALGNAGTDTAFTIEGFTFPTAHAVARHLNERLWRWFGPPGTLLNRKFWESVWGAAELDRRAADDLIARLSHEWRNATVAAEARIVKRTSLPATTTLTPRAAPGRPATRAAAAQWALERRNSTGESYSKIADAYNEEHPSEKPLTAADLRSAIYTLQKKLK